MPLPQAPIRFTGCYVFCFSIIMLNTDRHSSQIQAKEKITFEGWRANNRGINEGKDVPGAYQRQYARRGRMLGRTMS